MPRPAQPLPVPLRNKVFTAQEALASGVGRDRLRRADVVPAGRGLHCCADVAVTEIGVVAAMCRTHQDAEASGLTAARLRGFPLPAASELWSPGDPITMQVERDRRRRNTDAVVWTEANGAVRQLTRGWADAGIRPSTFPGGARVADPISTFFSLGRTLEHDELVVVGDHLVRIPRLRFDGRGSPIATLSQLRDAAALRFPGAPRIRRALADVRVSADSPMETRLRLACIRAGLPEPLANHRLILDGEHLGEPDLYWPDYRVCAEYDGESHLSVARRSHDIRMGERRRERGIVEIRILADQMRGRLRPAVARIEGALRARGWRSRSE